MASVIFEGCNIVRILNRDVGTKQCEWCASDDARYVVHSRDDSRYYCTYDLQRFLVGIIAHLEFSY